MQSQGCLLGSKSARFAFRGGGCRTPDFVRAGKPSGAGSTGYEIEAPDFKREGAR
jgi:hypothetical protein